MSLGVLAQAAAPARPGVTRRAIPFDYSFRFDLRDPADQEPGSFVDRLFSQTVTISIEAAFTAVSIGYGLLPQVKHLAFGPTDPEDFETVTEPALRVPAGIPPQIFNAYRDAKVNLRAAEASLRVEVERIVRRRTSAPPIVTAFQPPALAVVARPPLEPVVNESLGGPPRQLLLGTLFNSLSRALNETRFAAKGEIGPRTASVLAGGFRLNPEVAKAMLLDDGQEALEADELEELFETLDLPPEGVQFLFALHDEGTGRAFQSDPLLNIASLGIANGDRPFRHFAQPITFAPQTQIRLDVVPKSEFKGELHVVLHGYKVLGGAGTPTGRAARRRARRSR